MWLFYPESGKMSRIVLRDGFFSGRRVGKDYPFIGRIGEGNTFRRLLDAGKIRRAAFLPQEAGRGRGAAGAKGDLRQVHGFSAAELGVYQQSVQGAAAECAPVQGLPRFQGVAVYPGDVLPVERRQGDDGAGGVGDEQLRLLPDDPLGRAAGDGGRSGLGGYADLQLPLREADGEAAGAVRLRVFRDGVSAGDFDRPGGKAAGGGLRRPRDPRGGLRGRVFQLYQQVGEHDRTGGQSRPLQP
jgi:hypothetical protein